MDCHNDPRTNEDMQEMTEEHEDHQRCLEMEDDILDALHQGASFPDDQPYTLNISSYAGRKYLLDESRYL